MQWQRKLPKFVYVVICLLGSNSYADQSAISIPGLIERDYESSLTVRQKLGDFDGYSSYSVNWDSDGLQQSAIMNVPSADAPAGGFPVMIMCHGNSNGRWDTIKDYYSTEQASSDYRQLPFTPLITRYAQEGYIVLLPDYRGHGFSETNGRNPGHWQLDTKGDRLQDKQGSDIPRIMDDDGLRFGGWLYTAHYTIDILNLMAALTSFDNPPDDLKLDPNNLFLWGRSLGGDVAARAMLVNPQVKAASLWVPATMSLWDQAHYYHYDAPNYADGFSLEALMVEVEKYNAFHDTRLNVEDLNPARFVSRLSPFNKVLVQVSIDDPGARSAWGIQYHHALRAQKIPTELVVYPGPDHVFKGETLEKAIEADLEFFRSHRPAGTP